MRPHWDGSDALWRVDRVALCLSGGSTVWYDVDAVRQGPQGPLLKVRGVDDRDGAEQLRGATVLVDRSALPDLEPGEYYLADLVGCEVRCGEKLIGEVAAVFSHPTVDTIVIRGPDGVEVEQPLVSAWLDEVVIGRRLIVLTSEDGIIR